MKFLFDKTYSIKSILVLAICSVCIGRAYQCFFWDIPIRSLLWNEELLSGSIQTLFGLEWGEYLKHPNANNWITRFVFSLGIGLTVFKHLTIRSKYTKFRTLGVTCLTVILVFIAFLYHLEKFRTIGQFFEYSLQFMSPLLYLFFIREGFSSKWVLWAKAAVALTFLSHGLYAVGLYPVPGNFVAMTINILGCQNDTAITLLQIVGIIDIVASIGIFFSGRIMRWSLWYCIVWGVMTSLARIVANFDMYAILPSLHQWAYQAIYRAPHFLIPMAIYFGYKSRDLTTVKG